MVNSEKRVTVAEIKEFFRWELICGDEKSLSRLVSVPDINRPGLELTGFFKHTEPKRIVILGDKEHAYIETLSEVEQEERFDKITSKNTPAIIISHENTLSPVLQKVCDKKNFPVLQTKDSTNRIIVDLISFLDEKLAPSDSMHGVLLNVYGKGVLITGESGVGKSEIALELIKKGHTLVADDRVDVSRIHNTLVGEAPELLKGVLEIRGIGIIDIVQMFGASASLHRSNVDFIVHLEQWNTEKDYRRVGLEEENHTRKILGLEIPELVFPVKEGRNMAVLIESAVTDFTLKLMDINSAKEFEDRVYNYILKQNEEKGETK